ncbi:SpoIIE family protein phosphatase [Planctomycetaceae bacterium]|nr:SpoIIE family protein phosphatase [Planctomycetaceae bacterium]
MSPSEKSSELEQFSQATKVSTDALCWQLFDEIPIPLFTLDVGLRFLSLNVCFQALSGYSQDALIGESVLPLLGESSHGSPESFLKKRYEQEFRPSDQETAEFELRLKTGDRVPIEIKTSRVYASSYRLLLCSVIDISERKQSRKALIESQNRLREILDNTENCVYVKDLEGRYQFVNRRFEELLQLRLDALVGKTDVEIFPKSLAETFRQNDIEVVERGETIQVKEIAPHEDGPHLYLSSKFPLRNQQGEIHAIAGISTDITQMDQQEREVKRLKSTLELILDSVSDGIIGGSRTGDIEYMNRAARLMLRLGEDTQSDPRLIQDVRFRATPQDQNSISIQELFHDLISKPAGALHYPSGSLVFKGGTSLPTDVTCCVTENDEGTIETVVTLRDTSHLVQLQLQSEELRTAQIVQRQLYPTVPPVVNGFCFAGRAIPATQACGDYFDFITSDDVSDIVLTIGDVTGHGLGPALQMVETRAYLRAMIHQHGNLKTALAKLNQFLVEDTPEGSFISLMAACINPETRRMSYVGAGHDGWLIRQSGEVEYLASTGLLLGLMADSEYKISPEIEFQHGDLFVMATDGLQEATSADGELFGSDRMIEAILQNREQEPADIIETLVTRLNEYVDHRPLLDDITMVVARADFDE